MKPPVYFIVDFRVRQDSVSNARTKMRKVERAVRQNPGCLQFHFLQDLDDPAGFSSYGIFASQGDLDLHMAKMKESSTQEDSVAALLDPDTPLNLRVMDRV